MPDTADKTTNPRSAAVATDLARTAKTAKGRGADKVERMAKRFAVKDVNLYYGDFHAVKDVTMPIEANQVTALIGSSGCGKTTMLRSLNRMHELTPGARVDGEKVADEELQRQIDSTKEYVLKQAGPPKQSPIQVPPQPTK